MSKSKEYFESLAAKFPTEQMKELALQMAGTDLKIMYILLKFTLDTCEKIKEHITEDSFREYTNDIENQDVAKLTSIAWMEENYDIENISQFIVYLFANIKGQSASKTMDDFFYFAILGIQHVFKECDYSDFQLAKFGGGVKRGLELQIATWFFRAMLLFPTTVEISEEEKEKYNLGIQEVDL